MVVEASLAQTRGRRVIKAKKFADESPPSRNKEKSNGDDDSSKAVATKRKNTNDAIENGSGRPVRSKAKNDNGESDPKISKASSSAESKSEEQDHNETDDITKKFIATLEAKTGPFNKYSMEGKECNLKITTFNINGLRSWLTKQNGFKFIRDDQADILCFQETKCGDSKVPAEIKNQPGYRCYVNGSDDGHSGVLCLSKKKPIKVTNGIGIEVYDKEARVITMEFEQYYVVNVYVPNSGRGLVRLDFRMKWDADFLAYLKDLDSVKPVIVCGDLNVSHHEIDLANPKTNLKTAGFTIGERNNFSKLLDETQLVDIFRLLNPGKLACYTYWSYMKNAREKNIGWRLDYFLISRRIIEKTCDVVIQNDVQGSDHCPVSMYLAV